MADRPIVHVGEQPQKPYYCPINHKTGELLPVDSFPDAVGPEDLRFCSEHASPQRPIWMLSFDVAMSNGMDGQEMVTVNEFKAALAALFDRSENVLHYSVSEFVQLQ